MLRSIRSAQVLTTDPDLGPPGGHARTPIHDGGTPRPARPLACGGPCGGGRAVRTGRSEARAPGAEADRPISERAAARRAANRHSGPRFRGDSRSFGTGEAPPSLGVRERPDCLTTAIPDARPFTAGI